MATVKLLSDQEAAAIPAVQAVFDDIRATRKTDFINNFWRALANDPANLKRVWETLKSVMTVEGAIDPLTREMIYIAVSTANACQYCIQSHTAAARARGMTDAQHGELLTIIGLAAQTNHLARDAGSARSGIRGAIGDWGLGEHIRTLRSRHAHKFTCSLRFECRASKF